MIAANEWQRFEESYVRYGLDLAPESRTDVRRERKAKAAQKTSLKVRPRDKMIILLLIFLMGVCGVVLVCLHAYESDINYNIYKLSQQANELNGEIDNLNVDINSYNDLDEIEEYATDNLGMRYPSQDQFVHIGALMGTQEVNDYVAALAAEQRGIGIQTDYTLSQAAMDLLS